MSAAKGPCPSLQKRDERFRFQFRKTELCSFHERGVCSKGSKCPFAHGRGELRPAPDLAKTSLCRDWQKSACTLGSDACPFAHGRQELRTTAVFSDRRVPYGDDYRSRGRFAKNEQQPVPEQFQQQPVQVVVPAFQWTPPSFQQHVSVQVINIVMMDTSRISPELAMPTVAGMVVGGHQPASVPESTLPYTQAARADAAEDVQGKVQAILAQIVSDRSTAELLTTLQNAAAARYEE